METNPIIELEECPCCRGNGILIHEGGWNVQVECADCSAHTVFVEYNNEKEKKEAFIQQVEEKTGNKEKKIESRRNYVETHKELILNRAKKYREAHLDECKKKCREYHASHKEEQQAKQKAYREEKRAAGYRYRKNPVTGKHEWMFVGINTEAA